jgi:DNA replication and repair protein RecF
MDLQMSSGINVFTGQNGQGKTSLLEAAYVLITSKSFRTHHLTECSQFEGPSFLVTGCLHKMESIWYPRVEFSKGILNRSMNQKKVSPLDYIKTGAVMIFSGLSAQVITGAPQERRKFLDQMTSLLDPHYLILQSTYRKQLKSLKKIIYAGTGDLTFYQSFKKTMIPVLEEMVSRRIHILNKIQDKVNIIYSRTFSETETIDIKYKLRNCSDSDQISERFLHFSAQELLYKKQFIGPHLDDIRIQLNQHEARKYSSSGQIRSLILSLLFAVRELYYETYRCYPILLMDDIDSELDEQRLGGCMEYILNRGQTLISSAKYGKLINSSPVRGYEISNGRINSLGQMND